MTQPLPTPADQALFEAILGPAGAVQRRAIAGLTRFDPCDDPRAFTP